VISVVCAASASAQTAAPQSPNRQPAKPSAQAAKPATKPADARVAAATKPVVKPEGIAPVSKSPLPTFYYNTYQRIAAAMLSYTTIDLRGGWPTIPKTAQLAPGASGADVATLRQRLIMTDDLAPDQDKGELFDETLEGAVKRFQARHGLTETGSVGPKTLAALNVPVKERLQQLLSTLDRISELNFQFGQRYVVVNIPAAVAEAVDGDKVTKRYVVVVGKVGRASPTLTTTINAVNLNPTWTVPLGIMKADVMPRMRRDPGYVSRMRMRVLDANGREVDPKSVDWTRSPNFSVRQDSGAGNALGAVRIDMPNKHSVYMHDTNHKEHFSRDYRFESSGCARVAEVRDLAVWLLSDNQGWSRKEIDAAIATGERKTINLTHKVPVAWVYFTGWVTKDDIVHFRDDIYDHDEDEINVALNARQLSARNAGGFVVQSAESKTVAAKDKPAMKEVSYLDSR
jgi:murein L,D-transpeptidase YcbB/YkuD